MLPKSYLLNNCAFMLLLSCLVSCQQEIKSHQKIIQSLDRELSTSSKSSYFVFIITESDCNACKKSVQRWLNKLSIEHPGQQLFGLYYLPKSRFSSQHNALMEDTKEHITWQALNNPQLLSEVSVASKLGSSPFLIHVENGELRYIKSINKELL